MKLEQEKHRLKLIRDIIEDPNTEQLSDNIWKNKRTVIIYDRHRESYLRCSLKEVLPK